MSKRKSRPGPPKEKCVHCGKIYIVHVAIYPGREDDTTCPHCGMDQEEPIHWNKEIEENDRDDNNEG